MKLDPKYKYKKTHGKDLHRKLKVIDGVTDGRKKGSQLWYEREVAKERKGLEMEYTFQNVSGLMLGYLIHFSGKFISWLWASFVKAVTPKPAPKKRKRRKRKKPKKKLPTTKYGRAIRK